MRDRSFLVDLITNTRFFFFCLVLKKSRGLTWSEVFGISDEVLHGLHHFSYRQILQDAFTHTNYLTHLEGNANTWERTADETKQ